MVEHNVSIGAYWRFLRSNKQYRILWLGEVINYTGTWFNYIATLSLTEEFGNQSGMLLSGTVILRFLPSFLWCAFAGALADKCNRRKILIWACLLDAVVVACFTAVHGASTLWLMYSLIFLQFSIETFYEPARKALVPLIVSGKDLPLATTLDGMCWSLTAAVGAACGGLAASKLGLTACFLIDSCTYLVAAACASQLDPMAVNPPAEVFLDDPEDTSKDVVIGKGGVGGKSDRTVVDEDVMFGAIRDGADGVNAPVCDLKPIDQPVGDRRRWSLLSDLWSAYVLGMSAIKEGFSYMRAADNRDVCVLVFIKASGALIWGATDVLNVRLAEQPSMQSLGDADTTLGVIYTAVGIGCLLGPFLFNHFTQPQLLPLLRAIAASFCILAGGYLLVYLSPNIFLMTPSSIIRAMGSATLWTYATLILQLRVPNHVLGRVMAVDASMYTLFQSLSAMSSGVAFDATSLSVHQLIALNTLLAVVVAGWWVLYYYTRWKTAKPADKVAYTPVKTVDQEEEP